MPRYDRTGPMGQGPMTGRRMGRCTGRADQADGYGPGAGFGYGRGFGRGFGPCYGRGFGRGFGRGLGFGRNFNPAFGADACFAMTPQGPVPPETDAQALEHYLTWLEQETQAVRDRLQTAQTAATSAAEKDQNA